MLKPIFLSDSFYADYSDCPEIEQKNTRPYICVQIIIDGILWAVPLRSHIRHGYALWTNKQNCCGLDFTKAVVIASPNEYISSVRPRIRDDEFQVLKKTSDHLVRQKMQKYIHAYKKAKEHPTATGSKEILSYSTLQYFEEYI